MWGARGGPAVGGEFPSPLPRSLLQRHVGGLEPVGLLRDWDLGAVSLCRCAVPSRVGRRAVVCRCTCVRSLTLESRVHEHSRRVLVCALSSGAARAGPRHARRRGGAYARCRVVGESPM